MLCAQQTHPLSQTERINLTHIRIILTNRRTADVRSVGYSELFSLSRDDVLAATTDYPEAREILQALGRKRLMEVRSINKKHAKHVSDKESIASTLNGMEWMNFLMNRK